MDRAMIRPTLHIDGYALFLCIISTLALVLAEPSELANKDFRFISYQDLYQSSDRFTDENVTYFSRFLFDVSRNQLIVGARDNLYRLSFSLETYEKRAWEASEPIIEMCKTKGASDVDCHNYIMVLQSYGNQLYACGTHAFSPQCSWRQMDSLNVTKLDKGVAKCPFNPHANITTLMTENGKLFIASPTDFSGTDPAILRADVIKEDNKIIRTDQYNSKWLNSPQFVGSFEAGEFVYFVFREAAVENINCGKAIYSRIARVCKSDPGGHRGSRDNWTSFAKARLNCSLPGEYPFYFNEVQGVHYSEEEGVLYATFTMLENNMMSGSAICAFNLSSINAAFSGPFKHQETTSSLWERKDLELRNQFECKFNPVPSIRHDLLMGSHRFQLMDDAVQPISIEPLFTTKEERLTHITLDVVATKTHNRVLIMYVANEDNLVKKLSILPRTRETCVIEIWQPQTEPVSKILTMHFLKHTDSLYIGTDDTVIRIPAQHCSRHGSRPNCLNSMDPYCGWNDLEQKCTTAPDGDPLKRFWIQQANECPESKAPIDGGWSAWSDWFKCNQHTDDHRHESSNIDTCLCRTRLCDNPTPKNGGASCIGTTISVTNCTVHGKWSEWGPWSVCSQTCGVAVKSRRRSCGNPAPAHGGRTCVGTDRMEMYCANLPPCPEPRKPQIDGGWGPWGDWSECSASCGGGHRFRTRRCDDPQPQHGGNDCAGCNLDYGQCNMQACPEVQKIGPWTPWLQQISNTTSNGEHLEKRFRYVCKFNGSDASSAKVYKAKEENRQCFADGTCHRVGDDNDLGFSDWSSWDACTVSCGGGQQYRTRVCERNSCEGTTKMARACNTQPCEGFTAQWSCWTDWSPCSVSCGVGKKTRTRRCLSTSVASYSNNCEGSSVEYEPCEMPTCDSFNGWSTWSEWSECDYDERIRTRKCLTTDPDPSQCQGNEREIRSCNSPLTNEVSTGSTSVYMLVFVIVLLSCSNFFIFMYMKKRPIPAREMKNIGSPCFDSFPNQYSSLPTKEDRPKVKRQSSFSGINGTNTRLLSNGHGTLTKTNNVSGHQTPKVLSKSFVEVDTATIKRNSHGLNNARPIRSAIDDDKF